MNFEEITADQVKNEIETLTREYPDRYGSTPGYDDDSTCVYYTNERGRPVWYETMNLVTPVCIVGMWVDQFYPELKDHPQFSRQLHLNTPMRDVTGLETPLNMDVMSILVKAQDQQDKGIPWSRIKL